MSKVELFFVALINKLHLIFILNLYLININKKLIKKYLNLLPFLLIAEEIQNQNDCLVQICKILQ